MNISRFVAVRISATSPIISSPAYTDRDGLEKIHQWLLENGRNVQSNRGGWVNVYCFSPAQMTGGRVRSKTRPREDREAQERMNLYPLARWDGWDNPRPGHNSVTQPCLDLLGLEPVR